GPRPTGHAASVAGRATQPPESCRMTADAAPAWRIGIDIGGTFTDLVLADANGDVRVFKVPSVPSDPAQGAFDAVAAAAAGVGTTVEELLGATTLLVHRSTIARNTGPQASGAQ